MASCNHKEISRSSSNFLFRKEWIYSSSWKGEGSSEEVTAFSWRYLQEWNKGSEFHSCEVQRQQGRKREVHCYEHRRVHRDLELCSSNPWKKCKIWSINYEKIANINFIPLYIDQKYWRSSYHERIQIQPWWQRLCHYS